MGGDQQAEAASRLLQGYGNDAFLQDLQQVRLRHRPGTQAAHSNVAAQLLGLVIARTYGKPFAQVLQDKIERPAGMRSGTTLTTEARSATGYDDRHRPMPPFRGESLMPAGGLRYSAQDMARYLHLLLALDDRAVQLSQQPRFTEAADRQIAFTWVARTGEGQLSIDELGPLLGPTRPVPAFRERQVWGSAELSRGPPVLVPPAMPVGRHVLAARSSLLGGDVRWPSAIADRQGSAPQLVGHRCTLSWPRCSLSSCGPRSKCQPVGCASSTRRLPWSLT